MAVAFDATIGSVTTTWSHTNSAAGNALIVAVETTGSAITVTGVTYGGQAPGLPPPWPPTGKYHWPGDGD